MKCVCITVLSVLGVARIVGGYPFEVPKSACVDMSPKGPGHNDEKPQSSKLPYEVKVSSQILRTADSVEITISQKTGGPPIAAFMVQVRAGSSTTPLGTFQPKGDNARTVTCSAENDTGSHNSPDPKKSVTLIWTPPTNFKGQATVYVTVAETKHKFWVHQKVSTVSVK